MRRALLLALLALLPLAPPRAAAGDPVPSSPPPVRVFVGADGFYRVKADALRALGYAPTSGRTWHVRASHRGRPVPVLRSGVEEGDVVFLWRGDGVAHQRRAVVLEPGTRAPGRQRGRGPADPPPAPPAPGAERSLAPPPQVARPGPLPTLYGELAAAERDVYDQPAPTTYLARIAPGQTWSLAVDAAAEPGTRQELSIAARITAPTEPRLTARHGGVVLDRGGAGGQFVWTLPAVDPRAPVEIRNDTSLPPATANDVSDDRGTVWVEWATWSGRTRTLPPERYGLWTARPTEGYYPLALADDAELFALRLVGDYNLGPPTVLQGEGRPGRRLLWDGDELPPDDIPPGPQHVYAATGALGVVPERIPSMPSPLDAARGAEHVILSTQACLAGARRLAEHRTRTGTPSVAVAATDVYEALAGGEQDPQALRTFLRTLLEESGGRTPRYVLLAGDAVRDRSDRAPFETLPTLLARTQYNGATPADSLYVEADDAHGVGSPSVGRLPFRDARAMDAYVDRLIAYEATPPVDASRRRIRFLANEARFGPQVDAQIELFFRLIVTQAIPQEFDVEVTFASPSSQFLWPAREFNEKVIASLNEGALFYTYVGHGFGQGFDSLHVGTQRFPVLHLKDVARVDVTGTPPIVFAIACTTAEFDDPETLGLGEALLARPHGPIAYAGATRLCHPAGNVFLGRGLAYALFREPTRGRRLGDVLTDARDMVLDVKRDPVPGQAALLTLGASAMLPKGTGVTLQRLQREAFWLHNLLGDPGTLLPLPERLADLTATWRDGGLDVEAAGLPEGARVTFSAEVGRGLQNPLHPLTPGLEAANPAHAEAIRTNHGHANDKVVLRAEVAASAGRAAARLAPAPGARPLDDPAFGGALVVKAWVEAGARVLLGVREVRVPAAPPK